MRDVTAQDGVINKLIKGFSKVREITDKDQEWDYEQNTAFGCSSLDRKRS